MQDPVLLRALCPKALGVFTGGCLSPRRFVRPPKHKRHVKTRASRKS